MLTWCYSHVMYGVGGLDIYKTSRKVSVKPYAAPQIKTEVDDMIINKIKLLMLGNKYCINYMTLENPLKNVREISQLSNTKSYKL